MDNKKIPKKSGSLNFIENVELTLKDKKTGKILNYEKVSNTIVDIGIDRVANLINGGSTTSFKYIAIGTGSTSSTTSDTALETEVKRELATLTNPTNQAVFEKEFTFGSGESYTIEEVGTFDQATASGSTMLNRITSFTAKEVTSENTLTVTITITTSRA